LILLVAVVMVVVLVVAVLRRAGGGSVPGRSSRAELERMTHDRCVADRLIERMRAKHPDASDARLIQLAIAELRADRRR
jgi:hypothetical protein